MKRFLFLALVLSIPARASFPDVCFSPKEACDTKLTAFMMTAKATLDVAIYDLNLPSVTAAIIAAAKTMKVRVVVDKMQSKGRDSTVPQLVKAGVEVRYGKQKGSGIMHNKFTIVDGRFLEAGSFNYTAHATGFNHENQFYTDAMNVVVRYSDYFSELWATGVPVQ